MNVRTWLLAAIGLGILAITLATYSQRPAYLPFDVHPFGAGIEVQPSSWGLPMPAGLKAGDRSYFRDMDPTARQILIMMGGAAAPPGTAFILPVRHGTQLVKIPVQTLQTPRTPLSSGTDVIGTGIYLLITALGLMLLWRGEGLAARGVAAWCIAWVVSGLAGAAIPYLSLFYLALLVPFSTYLLAIGTLGGLFMMAEGLTADGFSSAATRRLRAGFVALLIVYLIESIVVVARLYATGEPTPGGLAVSIALHLIAFAIPLGMLIFGYRRVSALNRARIRWIVFGLLLIVLAYVVSFAFLLMNFPVVTVVIAVSTFTAVAFAGFAYAVLRHQLVSLQFVLNRALVYGFITSLVVSVFAGLLALLERSALSTSANRFLALFVSLLLGMGLNTLKHRLDTYINRIFFRGRQRAQAELEEFARSCAFVDDPRKLLDLTADEFHRNSDAQGVALYLAAEGGDLACVRELGSWKPAERLDANDPGLLRLRAGSAELALGGAGMRSALGNEGYAYALAVRGELLGIVVCGPRPGDEYTPEERRLFGLVAQQVGVALHGLRLYEQQRVLRQIADGAFASLADAQTQARSAIAAGQTS